MRRVIPFVVIIILGTCQNSTAQSQVFRLKAWTTMPKKEWRNVIYRFPEFQEGRITLLEGFSPSHPLKLNFNIYFEKIEFITEKGDTTGLENSPQIKSVTIGEHIFYNDYPEGYVEKISSTPVALGVKYHLSVMFESGTGERFVGTDWHLPTSRYDRLYTRKDSYFFIDKNSQLHDATQPAILKLYTATKKELKKYIKESKVDFKVKADLVRLLDFCTKFD